MQHAGIRVGKCNRRVGQTTSGVGSMTDTKHRSSFAGAAELVTQAEVATLHLRALRAACENGDKLAARKALRQAISELEVARAMFRTGVE
jgi:DNA-binding FadR family transcriptional regulator